MSERSPAFQFYFKDWRSSRRVQRLSFKERGMYLEMLIDQWDKGALPQQPEAIAELIGAKPAEFLKSWPTLKQFYVQSDDGWVNERLERERAKQAERKNRASDWGKASAEKRWGPHADKNGSPISDGVALASRPSNFAIASAIASAGASATAVQRQPPKHPDARSRRPIYTSERFAVFEWQLDELCKMLGSHYETFDLHSFFDNLTQSSRTQGLVIPREQVWPWLQAQTLAEARRRGLPMASGEITPERSAEWVKWQAELAAEQAEIDRAAKR